MSESIVTIDPNDLTLGELMDFEEASGEKVSDVFAASEGAAPSFSARTLTALVWVIRRRDDPNYSLDDARTVKIGDLAVQT